jgi:hypothetical protein
MPILIVIAFYGVFKVSVWKNRHPQITTGNSEKLPKFPKNVGEIYGKSLRLTTNFF